MSRWKLSKMLLPLLKKLLSDSWTRTRGSCILLKTQLLYYSQIYTLYNDLWNTLKTCYIIESLYNKHFNIESYSVQWNDCFAFSMVANSITLLKKQCLKNTLGYSTHLCHVAMDTFDLEVYALHSEGVFSNHTLKTTPLF